MKYLVFILCMTFIGCGPIICQKRTQKCENDKIMVCTGQTWEVLQDCSMYDVKPLTCDHDGSQYFCE